MRHGVAAWVVEELAERRLPVPQELERAARAQLAAGLKVKRLTLAVLDALAQTSVTPVLLKGYGLATRLYPAQPLSRPATDVDVLVLPDELARAETALTQLGLRERPVPGVEDSFEEHHHHAWVGPAGLVELHFRLFSGFGGRAFDDAAVRGRAREGRLDGRAVRWLSAEDEFLYLATHAANHGFLRLSWLVDLQRYLERTPELDWALVFSRARAARFFVPLATALELVERLLEVRLPLEAEREVRRARVRRRVDRLVFSAERVASARWSNDRLASFLLRLYLVDSPRQGLRHVVDGARRFWRQQRGGGDAEV